MLISFLGSGEESRGDEGTGLVKHSCHDSGIDIRDEVPLVPLPKKTSYCDADVLLAGDGEFLPPIPVQPLPVAVEEEKKKQSVSFSIDDEKKEPDTDKHDKKKNNVSFYIIRYFTDTKPFIFCFSKITCYINNKL